MDKLLALLPKANPGYEPRLHLVAEWVIEFDDDGLPGREVGLDCQGRVVLAGPSSSDYGFWLDTNMRYEDFSGEPVSQREFESLWLQGKAYRSGSGR